MRPLDLSGSAEGDDVVGFSGFDGLLDRSVCIALAETLAVSPSLTHLWQMMLAKLKRT